MSLLPPDLYHPLAVKIRKQTVQAISDFELISSGDRVVVCVSGGKDSSILLALLKEIQRRAPYEFTLEAVILDQKQPGFDSTAFETWIRTTLGVRLTVLERDTYTIVKEKIKSGTFCSLCSRLRRGILYDYAHENQFSKMALGHHRDDLNETLLMNLFYTGNLGSMPPKLLSDDERNTVIRPLSYVSEDDLTELANIWNFPIIPCNLCGSQEGLKRKKIKSMIKSLRETIPAIEESMLTAQKNIKLSQLLDPHHWPSKIRPEIPSATVTEGSRAYLPPASQPGPQISESIFAAD